MSVSYAVTVDTEEEWDWAGPWPVEGYGVSNIAELPRFQDFCDDLGAAVTYFTNYAVMNNPQSSQIIQTLTDRENVEIGLHIHPWNTPPITGAGRVEARNTYIHNLPDEEQEAKLNSVFESFACSGIRPTSFRGGRYSSGPVVQKVLQRNGVVADSSIFPFQTWDDDGAPDYRECDVIPYRIPPENGESPLWVLPVSSGFTRHDFKKWHRRYEFISNTWLRKARIIGLMEKFGVVRKTSLKLEAYHASEMIPLLHRLKELDLSYVCLCLHSSSLVAGHSPYARTESESKQMWLQMKEMLETLDRMDGFVPATMTAIANELEQDHLSKNNE